MKLLLIMPNFFDYPQLIVDELESMGYEVDYFDDRPSTNPWIKAAIRINPNMIKKYIVKYFDYVMNTIIEKRYDVVFLISGQSLSFDAEMVEKIKKEQPQAKFVLYQWDSLQNFPRIEAIHPFFDKKFSFDRKDCEEKNELVFLPLFYSRRYEELGQQDSVEYEYDFCFVGTAHPKKYKFIQMMSEQLEEVYSKQYIYFFLPSRLVYFYRKVKNPEFKHASYKEFHYVPLSGNEMDKLYRNSRCVLDSPQEGQLGLTIRVIEALGAKKKIITTNKDIVNYDFYCEENVYVYDGSIDMNSSFFTEPYMKVEDAVYSKYSLRNWLSTILD